MNLEHARFNMIEQQIRPWDVLDQTTLETFRLIQREKFVPHAYKSLAFADIEIPLQHDEYMMFPRLEARMLQALSISSNDNCLEIGTGSGFVTACLAKLGKHVDSVDLYEDFTQQAEERLFDNKVRNYTLHTGDAMRDWTSGQSYDVIAITGSLPQQQSHFEAQLAPNGRLFVVHGQGNLMQASLVTRDAEGECSREILFDTYLRPLVGADDDSSRQFIF